MASVSEPAPARTLLRRLAQAIGAVASATTVALWALLLWSPSSGQALPGWGSIVVSVFLLIAAVIGTIAAIKGHGNVMLAMFLVAFLPVGGVLLWASGWEHWIGALNLIYLLAALIVRWTRPVNSLAS